MRTRAAAVTIAAFVLAMSMFVGVSAAPQNGHVKWLYLLYLDADNNLDTVVGPARTSVVGSDFEELMSVGSTKDVVCYVLVDRWTGPANLFKVEKGSMQEMKSSSLNGKEINMGDPATLRSFVKFALAANPADHTLLIFWDHGSPRGVAWDDHASDAGGGDFLSHHEVVQALSGYKIDVIGADECNVGHMEVAYQYATSMPTEYLVAAETYTGWRGFPYDWTLKELTSHPSWAPRDVAIMMVDQTQLLLNQPPYMGERINSHSAIDLGNVRALASSLKGLTDILTPNIGDYAGVISKARGNAQYCYGANAINLIDLGTFIARIGSEASSKEVKDACAAVLTNLGIVVVKVHATGSLQNMICGLGISFPDHSWELPSYYEGFAFASKGWLDFIEAYWAVHGSV